MRYRIRLVPSHDGTPLAIVQVKWLGLFWRDHELLQNPLHRERGKLVEAYRKLHDQARKVEEEARRVDAELGNVAKFGDRLKAVGPEWADTKLPVFVRTHQAIMGPEKADVDKVLNAIKSGDIKNPDDLGLTWPPKDRQTPEVGTRSAYLLDRNFIEALANGIVREGRPYSHVVRYHKPEPNKGQQNQQKGGNQNQQRNNQGGKQGQG